MAILLPDILDNNALPENFEASVTREKLLKFQEYLSKFDEAELTKDFNSTQQVHSQLSWSQCPDMLVCYREIQQ